MKNTSIQFAAFALYVPTIKSGPQSQGRLLIIENQEDWKSLKNGIIGDPKTVVDVREVCPAIVEKTRLHIGNGQTPESYLVNRMPE